MKIILIGMIALNSLLASAEVGKCSYFMDEDSIAKNRITKALSASGYKKVSHINDASYLVESRDHGSSTSLNIVDLKDNSSIFYSSNVNLNFREMNPLIEKMKGRLEKCVN